MSDRDLNSRIKTATKWSTVTEIVAKLITPIISMVLARLLTPEVFGVVATLTMIICFAEIFTDAGFQKYLIQHEFKDETDRNQSTTVAFWSNFVMSLLIWGIIALFCEPLAVLVGNSGLGYVIAISCVNIPLEAFSSIQMALFKRNFDFKTLFKIRIVGILIPLVVTIPLALWLRNYWALVFGTIAGNLANAVLLTYYSSWKPQRYYSFKKFQEMFAFSVWSVFEQISIWLTNYLDIFIIGLFLSSYYLGIYKTAMATVAQIMTLITAATTPILFSALSRLQNDKREFERMFFNFQKWVGILVIPIGAGIYFYSDFITDILLGCQWKEASDFIGLWGLTSAITIVSSHFCSEVYRALGKPKFSVLAQWLHIIVLLPAIYCAIDYGYETLYVVRSWVRMELVVVNLVLMYLLVKVSVWRMITNILPSLMATGAMAMWALLSKELISGILGSICSCIVCVVVYSVVIMLFPKEREAIRVNMLNVKKR